MDDVIDEFAVEEFGVVVRRIALVSANEIDAFELEIAAIPNCL
jgi:hypothetical protein